MPLFRRKPIAIEARRLTDDSQVICDLVIWINNGKSLFEVHAYHDGYVIYVPTTGGGWHRAAPGNWIIKDMKGEFSSCVPDLFELLYESENVPADITTYEARHLVEHFLALLGIDPGRSLEIRMRMAEHIRKMRG